MTDHLRVALYVRVSTDEQARSGYSIPDQIRELTRHAEGMGYEVVVPPIVDNGFSGASPNRPGLAQVIDLAETGQIDLAIATKRDRWFRSRLYRLMLDEDMEEYGCRLVALNDTNNQIGDGVQDEFAEWERKEITKRTRAGKMQKARSGSVVQSAAPYGFRRVGEGKDTRYEQDPATMPIVRRIIEMVAAGSSLRSIKCGHGGKAHPARALEERVEAWVLSLVRDPEVLREKAAAQAGVERQRLSRASHELARLRARLETIAKTRRGYLKQQAEGVIQTVDELRALLAPLDAERAAVESEIEVLGDHEDRLRKLDMLPALVDEYLRDLAYLVEGSGLPMREYETVPEERTEDNPLGVYTLTPENIRHLTEEELSAKRLEARNARSARFRDLYQSLGLAVVVHKDGTLEFSSPLGAPERVLPSVTPASMGVSG